MNRDSISDLAKCSKKLSTINKFGVAAASAVATLFVLTLILFSVPASAAVRVEGLNDWLSAAAERSLGAVYDHIPQSESVSVKEELLTLVANRLLLGYRVDFVNFGEKFVTIALIPSAESVDWNVEVIAPSLSPPVDKWFASDVAGLRGKIEGMMSGVPMEALIWGDIDLKAEVEDMCAEILPGWRVSLMIRTNQLGHSMLEVAFTPRQPLTLAVTPRISSTSIPVMLHSNLKDDLLKGFAPVIGIPVPWLDRHSEDMAAFSVKILKEESLVDMAKAEPEVTLRTGSVSELDIDLESGRYAAWIWMAVYAGAEGKYPEAGVHFGRRVKPMSGWDAELFTELIVSLEDWELETRLGMRWAPWRDFWVGGEWSTDENIWWARATYEPRRLRRPYAWFRYSEDSDTNAALGMRINDYLSIELHYDSRDDDPWNVRALVNL